MILILSFLLGAIVGWFRAKRRKASALDQLQYAAVHGILFALLGIMITLAYFWFNPS